MEINHFDIYSSHEKLLRNTPCCDLLRPTCSTACEVARPRAPDRPAWRLQLQLSLLTEPSVRFADGFLSLWAQPPSHSADLPFHPKPPPGQHGANKRVLASELTAHRPLPLPLPPAETGGHGASPTLPTPPSASGGMQRPDHAGPARGWGLHLPCLPQGPPEGQVTLGARTSLVKSDLLMPTRGWSGPAWHRLGGVRGSRSRRGFRAPGPDVTLEPERSCFREALSGQHGDHHPEVASPHPREAGRQTAALLRECRHSRYALRPRPSRTDRGVLASLVTLTDLPDSLPGSITFVSYFEALSPPSGLWFLSTWIPLLLGSDPLAPR